MKLIPNPNLSLKTEELKTWPYWMYGYYSTDGCNWRQYSTNKGWRSIPDYAEEAWPIASCQ